MVSANFALGQENAAQQFLQVFFRRKTRDLHQISLFHAKSGMHELMRQLTVVREQEKAFTVLIKSADRIYALFDMRNQIDGPRSAAGIIIGTQITARFID